MGEFRVGKPLFANNQAPEPIQEEEKKNENKKKK